MDVGDLVAYLKVQKDRSVDRELDGLGARGERAGAAAGRGFATRFLAGLAGASDRAGTEGQTAAARFGVGFSRVSATVSRTLTGAVGNSRARGTAPGGA